MAHGEAALSAVKRPSIAAAHARDRLSLRVALLALVVMLGCSVTAWLAGSWL